jgi:hypothetical protein
MKLRDLHWALHFLVWTLGIVAVGAVLGAVVFPLVGSLAGVDKSAGELALTGARTLGFYFMVWAPGVGIVLTVKNEYERRRRKAAEAKKARSSS